MALPLAGRLPALALVAALALAGAGCSDDEKKPSGGGDDGPTPEEVLALAKTTLDETSGVNISLSTEEVPSGVTGIKSATGVGAHPAAFEGEFELSVNGLPATAEVIAVDGTTYAKNSLLLPDWTEIDPADYGAPDPATLMEPDGGFSGLIAAITGAEEGDSVRGGEDNERDLHRVHRNHPVHRRRGADPHRRRRLRRGADDQRRRRAAQGRAERGVLRGRGRPDLHCSRSTTTARKSEITAP